MKRVLFVDDEPNVLEGLRRALRSQRAEWEICFAASGAAALDQLAQHEFDVVVSDMRMPGMDGIALLGEIQRRYPHTARIVMSGQTEDEAALRSVAVAHQFLSKPCETAAIKQAIERTCELNDRLKSRSLRDLVAGLGALPAAPRVYMELTDALSRPDVAVGELASIVERDPAITVKVLQIVNSGFFGLPRRVTSIRHAISYLGASSIQSLVISTSVFQVTERQAVAWFPIEAEQRHGFLTARLAGAMFTDPPARDAAFTSGMVHDVGVLVLATSLGEKYRQILTAATDQQVALAEAESAALGTTHAEAGAHLLSLWGLPASIVEAVAFHHSPEAHAHASFGTSAAVHIADCLAHEAAPPGRPIGAPLGSAYVERLGVAERVAEWRAAAAGVEAGIPA